MDDLRVLFFGDSFVAGAGDPEGRGWVGRATAGAFAAGRPLTAYNLGVRHQTSVQVEQRWRAETLPRLFPGACHGVVFAVGANDASLAGDGPRVTPDASRAALGALLDGAAELGVPAAVAGPPPMGDASQRARTAALSDAFGDVCAARAAPFWAVPEAPLRAAGWFEEADAGDGRHPAARGYAALARLLLDAGLLDWLRAIGDLTPRA